MPQKTREEFEESKKKMENILINGLLQYVKDGINPKYDNEKHMICYNIIYDFTDAGYGEDLLNFHNEKIGEATNGCYERIKDLSGLDFIDSFIDCTNKLNNLIFFMSRTFFYTSNNYLKGADDENNVRKYKEDNVSEFSMRIYKSLFFDKLEDKIYDSLNENLIREERNGNKEYRTKIKTIMKTIQSMDFHKPKISKISKTIINWEEKGETNMMDYQNRWFNKFKEETKKYIKTKAEKDIMNKSAPEYVKCELKYLSEEDERLDSYVYGGYHQEIKDINYEYLIKDNAQTLFDMDTGIHNMFKNKKKDELSEIYQLFSFYPDSLRLIQESFKAYIKERYLVLKNDIELSKDPKKYETSILELKKEMEVIVATCFGNNNDFQEIAKKEFSILMG